MSDIYQEVQRLKDQVERLGSWESRGQFKGCRITHSQDQVKAASANWVWMDLDTEIWDYGAPFSNGMHSAIAVGAGTVTKAIGGTTLVGVGTSFTTQMVVGGLVYVSAGANSELNVITAIQDDMNLTVNLPWGLAAAGAGYSLTHVGAVIPAKGVYEITFAVQCNNATAQIGIFRNQKTQTFGVVGSTFEGAAGAYAYMTMTIPILCNRFDAITPMIYWAAGGTVQSRWGVSSPASPIFSVIRIS